MKILICQTCGSIIKNKTMFCSNCGQLISKFSLTSVPALAKAASSVAVDTHPNPIALEKTINDIRYPKPENGNHLPTGNGNGNGNGHNNEVLNEKKNGHEGNKASAPATKVNDPTSPIASILSGIITPNSSNASPSSQTLNNLFSFDNPEVAIPEKEVQTPEIKPQIAPQSVEDPPANLVANIAAQISNVAPVAPVAAAVPATPTPPTAATPPAVPTAPEPGSAAASVPAAEPVSPKEPAATPQVSTTPTASNNAEILNSRNEMLDSVFAPSSRPITDSSIADFFASMPPVSNSIPPEPTSQPPPGSNENRAQSNELYKPNEPYKESEFFNNQSGHSIQSGQPVQSSQSVQAGQQQAGQQQSAQQNSTQNELDDAFINMSADNENSHQSNINDPVQTQTIVKNNDSNSESVSESKSNTNYADGEYPDESVNRGKNSKVRDELKPADSTDSSSSNRSRFSAKPDDENKPEKTNQSKPINVLGLKLSKKALLITAVLVIFLGIPAISLVFGIISSIGGSISKLANNQQQTSMSGKWEVGYLDKGQVTKCFMNLNQSGSKIEGFGVDRRGTFQIAGNYANPKVQFNKQYIMGGQVQGKPILYAGKVDWVNPKSEAPFMHMAGIWQLQKRDGFGWRGRIITLQDKWEANLLEHIEFSPQTGQAGLASAPGNSLSGPDTGSPKKFQDFCMMVALGVIGIGCVLAFFSLKLFGPSGLINIWSKQEYIPSQFRSQHNKMLKELGKPVKKGGLPLGKRIEWGIHQFYLPRELSLPAETRDANPHMLVLGAGASGKSRLIAQFAAFDIENNDRAVAVIDSDGSLIDLLMNWIASHPRGNEFAKRVVIIDPTHESESFAYNPLEYPDDGDLQNAAEAVVYGFKAIYTEPPGSQSQWSPQTANILRNSALLLMANGKTLTDLPTLLSDNDFRDILLEKIERMKSEKAEYTTLVEAWGQYKRLARTEQWINWVEPILNRVQPMLGDPRIRPILTRTKGDLNLKDLISEGKILFVKIPQGQLGQNANLLGSLIVTGLKKSALSLSMKGSSRRHPSVLYLDEFDSFIEKDTFDHITSETRKLQIGFIGAAKTLQKLPEDYRNQIVIKLGTMACFALAKKDGDLLGPQMFRVDGRKIKHQTIQNVFNKVNTSPQFELIADEEKLNIDRVVGQEVRTFFCYRVGTVAGVFHLKTPDFNDVSDQDINFSLMEQMYRNSKVKNEQ